MSSQSDNTRLDSHADVRERLTGVYAAFNHTVTTANALAELDADPSWIDPDGDDRWARRVGATVVEHATAVAPETVDHLQALPEEFAVEDEVVTVRGAYVGTTTDDERFDAAFEHVYDGERGATLEVASDADPDFESR